MVELIIDNGLEKDKVLIPIVYESITWQTNRHGSASVLTFDVLKDDMLNFLEGNSVRLIVDDIGIFYGFIFSKKRDKSGKISITAYDQLRYFKNKGSISCSYTTASNVLKKLCKDFGLNIGEIEDTKYVFDVITETDKSLFDIVYKALDTTLQHNKEIYVLYDDVGKITLKNISSMEVDFVLTQDVAENYSYTSTIDSETYNRVQVTVNNKETKKNQHFIVQYSENINKWGILQLTETADSKDVAINKADALLKLHNKVTKNLSVSNVLGDLRIRAGSIIVVNLDVGDIVISNKMVVEKCKHVFNNDTHFMDLTLRGGEFSV